MQFINAKVGGSLLDFELDVDFEDTFNWYSKSKARGQVSELPIGNNHNISMMWETGSAYVLPQTSLHCSYDNQTCYEAMSVPVIFNVSSNQTYTSGGMILTVQGYGFTSGNINATVAGQNCTILTYSSHEFTCKVQAVTTATTPNATNVGSNGLRLRHMNQTGSLSWTTLRAEGYEYNESLALTMEVPYAQGDYYGSVMEGWFIPPETTNYRFYIACDD